VVRETALAILFWIAGLVTIAYALVLAQQLTDGVLATVLLMLTWYARKLYRLRSMELEHKLNTANKPDGISSDDD
jgi:ABC-type antimicrobial peptide transport system permease subunit